MSINKIIKHFFLRQNSKSINSINKRNSHISYTEIGLTNVISESDLLQNSKFVNEMKTHIWTKPPKSILCFLPYGKKSSFLAGGYNTIISLNYELQLRWNCEVFLCFFPVISDEKLNLIFKKDIKKFFPNFKFEIINYDKVFKKHVDIAFCNFWMGAYPLVKFNNCYEKYYLVQDHESQFYVGGAVSSLAERTLYFGFHKLTNSSAILKYLKFIDGTSSVYRYIPGINHKLYFPSDFKDFYKDKYSIVCYGRPSVNRNCFDLLLHVLINVKRILKDKIEIFTVGENFDVNDYGASGVFVNLGLYSNLQDLAELYRRCDIGISLISTPTFSYQHLEFMASGLCLVTNKQLGVEDLLIDKLNAIVCEPIIDIFVNRIVELIQTPELMKSISYNGIKFANNLNWNKCYDGIANYILSNKVHSC